MKRCLMIFAKEPAPGRVKTRLCSCLTVRQRTALYAAFVQDVLGVSRMITCEARYIAYDAGTGLPNTLRAIGKGYRFHGQRGIDLGARLHEAFRFAARNGFTRTVIIGTDAPDMPPSRVAQAFTALADHDLVLGPASDGGYYLIGLRRPNAALFTGVPWSTEQARAATLQNARMLQLRVKRLPLWQDVDDPAALQKLRLRLARTRDSAIAAHTREFIQSL